jgi:hypothetical protein
MRADLNYCKKVQAGGAVIKNPYIIRLEYFSVIFLLLLLFPLNHAAGMPNFSSAAESIGDKLLVTCNLTKSIYHEAGGTTVSAIQKALEIQFEKDNRFILDHEVTKDGETQETISKSLIQMEYKEIDKAPSARNGILIAYLNGAYLGEFEVSRSRFHKGLIERDTSYQSPHSIFSLLATKFYGPKVRANLKLQCF